MEGGRHTLCICNQGPAVRVDSYALVFIPNPRCIITIVIVISGMILFSNCRLEIGVALNVTTLILQECLRIFQHKPVSLAWL